MPTQEELTKQRKLLQVRYALEDYHESIRNLSKVGVAHLLLAAVWLISIVAGSTHNWSHIGICCVVGLSLLVLARQPHWSRQLLMMATGGYVLSLLIEALLFGLPDILIPKLNMHEWRGFPVFINHLTPYVYWGLRIVVVGYFVLAWSKRTVLFGQHRGLLDKVLREVDGAHEII